MSEIVKKMLKGWSNQGGSVTYGATPSIWILTHYPSPAIFSEVKSDDHIHTVILIQIDINY